MRLFSQRSSLYLGLVLSVALLACGCGKSQSSAFVGSKRCAECHEDYEAQKQSNMGRTLWTIESFLDKHGPIEPETVAYPEDGVTYEVEPHNKLLYLTARRARGTADAIEQARQPFELVVGSGRRSVAFFSALLPQRGDPGTSGRRVEARIGWYRTESGWKWDWRNDIDPRRSTAADDLGPTHPENRCVECHAPLLQSQGGQLVNRKAGPGDRAPSPDGAYGVTCERCHGPGGAHAQDPFNVGTPLWPETAKFLQRAFSDLGLAEETRDNELARRAWTEVFLCGDCHRSNADEDDPRMARFSPAAMARSKCFQLSATKIRCTDCHDPHRNIEPQDTDRSIEVCLDCHQQNARQAACATGARDDCIRCHMPVRNVDPLVGLEFHHHEIGVFGPGDPPSKAGAPLGSNQLLLHGGD